MKYDLYTPNFGYFGAAGRAKEAGLQINSLYFPRRSGISVRRRVRTILPAPPFSLVLQRLRARIRIQPEKTPRFRGVLAIKPWPTRTGDGGFRAQKAQRPAFISVAKLGGSGSLLIRLGEGRNPVSKK